MKVPDRKRFDITRNGDGFVIRDRRDGSLCLVPSAKHRRAIAADFVSRFYEELRKETILGRLPFGTG